MKNIFKEMSLEKLVLMSIVPAFGNFMPPNAVNRGLAF